MPIDLEKLMRFAVEQGASDIFLKAYSPPCIRLHSQVIKLDAPPLTPEDVKDAADMLMSEEQMAKFEQTREMDLGFEFPGVSRFRVNLYQQRGTIGIVMRTIPLRIRTIQELGLPEAVEMFTRYREGFVLVTGATGSGKSTTLAALLDLINSRRRCHIVTIEDPIEYTYQDKMAYISQREVHTDTESFGNAMRAVLREAPDVILIGEMRDQETMSVCLQAAETGHLVFSTVHTASASETMERIINMFPPHDKPQICLRLSRSLLGIISQKLVPRADGKGRVPAVEILFVTPTVAQYIEEGRSGNIYNAIKEGGLQWNMQTMNESLARYYAQGIITEETALDYAGNRTELRQMLRAIRERAAVS
ncbi:MAG: type IV pilus twitching motility protein PilT, partial [Abditibacteriales bacterium]|nr:type IV pilus twitching motility protein PilT [Abditibacteriales bacterium]MDW8364911.1 type IV pilus twitching motility protein PilT [Abditibacteriales bacterium]